MIYLLIILLGIAADQAVKLSVIRHLQDGELLTVISNFFNITKTVNRGAAWSFLAGQAWGIYLLTAISAVALVVLLVCVYSTKEKVNRFGLSLMAAGCAGNLIVGWLTCLPLTSAVSIIRYLTLPIFAW